MKKIFIFILLVLIISNLIFCDLFKEQREVIFMASCDIITAPTGGTPVNVNDYNSQNNILQALLYNLMQNTKHLTEWDTLNEPDMAEGVYVQHGGALFLVQDGDLGIGGAPANGRVYVKATRALDALTFAFVNSAAGYSWNNVYCGFYHADGTQLLPYVLYLDSGNYFKFNLKFSIDQFDITSDIILKNSKNIGDWNMNASGVGSANITLNNFFDEKHIFIVSIDNVEIRKDSTSTAVYPLNLSVDPNFTENEGSWYRNTTTMYLFSRATGFFDSANFNDTSYNRGWVNYTFKV